LEELLQDRLDRLPLLAAACTDQALDRLELCRQRLLGVVVAAQQAAIDAVLDRGQVSGRLLVVADVELDVVHGLVFAAFPRRGAAVVPAGGTPAPAISPSWSS